MNHLWKSMIEKVGFVLAAMILLISPSTAWSVEKINIRYLVQGKKVIPVTCRIGHWEITDIKLPDLVVTNKQKAPVTVDQVDVIGKVSGSEAVRLQISGKPLSEAIAGTADMLNKQKSPLPAVQLSFGNVALPEGVLSENGTAVKEFAARTGLEKHGVQFASNGEIFAHPPGMFEQYQSKQWSVPQAFLTEKGRPHPDLSLKAGSEALGAGVAIPNVTRPAGKAPDLGALQFGQPLPHYGPR